MKKFLLLSILFFMVSCKEEKQKTTNEELIKSLYQYFNAHEWQKMADLYDENADFLDPSFGKQPVKQSRKQMIEKYSQLQAIFPDIKDSVQKIYLSGENNVIVEFISIGTSPDNTKFELPICTVFTIKQGKIIKDYTYYDNF